MLCECIISAFIIISIWSYYFSIEVKVLTHRRYVARMFHYWDHIVKPVDDSRLVIRRAYYPVSNIDPSNMTVPEAPCFDHLHEDKPGLFKFADVRLTISLYHITSSSTSHYRTSDKQKVIYCEGERDSKIIFSFRKAYLIAFGLQ